MVAKIISVMNQKGGTGKTTVAMLLASAFVQTEEKKVLVIDADPQGTATRWATAGEGEDSTFPAAVVNLSFTRNKIHNEVKKFINDYEIIIIDCPPAVDSEIPQAALIISDLALVPVMPSPPDLWATVGIKKLITNAETINESLKKLLVLNAVKPNTKLGREGEEVIVELGWPVAKAKLVDRIAFKRSAAYGTSVYELHKKDDKAIDEITMLANEVTAVLKL